GRWSDGSCPLACVNHDHGTDHNPSFGISIGTDGTILYNCFACGDGNARPMSHLFTAMDKALGEFPTEAYRTCMSVSRLMQLKAVLVPSGSHQSEALNENVVSGYPLLTRYTKNSTGYLKKYLRGRGATDNAYEHFRVRYLPGDPTDRVPKTLVTEFTNCDGSVSALRLKSVAAKDTKDHRGFTTLGSLGSSMFGLCQADTSKPLLVVEGEIDALCAYSFGFVNVVATGGATRSREALVSVLRLWSQQRVYLGLDCDKAGQEAQDKLINLLGSEVPHLYRVVWSYIKLAAPIPTKYGQRQTCKDPGDIKDGSDFWQVIEGAEYVGTAGGVVKIAG
ncbi:MAG: toprim domain-containing protein, partial [Desulfomonilaceae bacterium]